MIVKNTQNPNKASNLTLHATLLFGVAAPGYTKNLLRMQCRF